MRLPGAERRFARDDFAMVDRLCRRWSPTWRFAEGDLEAVKKAIRTESSIGYEMPAWFPGRVKDSYSAAT